MLFTCCPDPYIFPMDPNPDRCIRKSGRIRIHILPMTILWSFLKYAVKKTVNIFFYFFIFILKFSWTCFFFDKTGFDSHTDPAELHIRRSNTGSGFGTLLFALHKTLSRISFISSGSKSTLQCKNKLFVYISQLNSSIKLVVRQRNGLHAVLL